MRKKGKVKEKSDEQYEILNNKILELRDSVLEEFDLLELIEDSIKDVFECDLNCVTCSNNERGKCMQNFKKANLYWLRKIAQDEWMIKDVVEKLDGMRETLIEMMEVQKEFSINNPSNKECKNESKNKLTKKGHNFYI